MTARCLGDGAQSLLSHLFARQIGLRASQSLVAPQLPRALSCLQLLERQVGLGPQQSRRASQQAVRLKQRRVFSRPASTALAAQPMKQQDEADAVAAAAPAPDAGNGILTAAPPAADAHAADGSSAYESQLAAKEAHVRGLFADFQLPELEIFRSAPEHYRLRAEFRVWHKGEDTYYIMFEKVEGQARPQQVRVDTFPRGSVLMNELMRLLMQRVAEEPVLRLKLYQANFHTTLSGEAMVTLVYHRPLDAAWEEAAKKLRKHLAQAASCKTEEVTVIGRSRKRKLELDCSYVTEQLTVDGQQYTFRQVEGAFSQPNGSMCQHMLGWARSATAGSQGADLLELYCGNANFTVPLAANFRRVIATEVSKASVETAHHNLKVNGVQNVRVARMSSEEFTEAWRTKRQMKRLEGVEWSEVDLQTLLVDPPRAGLDDETVQLLKHFPTVVYISCNPSTLVANLREVKDTHEIRYLRRFAIFDQFPGTEHLECGAFLQRKPGVSAPADSKPEAATANTAAEKTAGSEPPDAAAIGSPPADTETAAAAPAATAGSEQQPAERPLAGPPEDYSE